MSCCVGQAVSDRGYELADNGHGVQRAEQPGDVAHVADAARGAEPASEVRGPQPEEPRDTLADAAIPQRSNLVALRATLMRHD